MMVDDAPDASNAVPRARRMRVELRTLMVVGALVVAIYTLVQGWLNREQWMPRWGIWAWLCLIVHFAGVPALVLALRMQKDRPLAAAARWGFCILVLWELCYLWLLQPYDRFTLEVTLGITCGLFGLSLLLAPRLLPSPPPPALRVADFALFNLCLVLVLTETALKIVAKFSPSPLLATVESPEEQRIAAHAFAPGQLRYGFPCNTHGFYDDEFRSVDGRDRPTVAMIGDSFSAGAVPHWFHFTTVIERALGNVDVLNVGVPGIGPDQYLHLVPTMIPLRPRVITVNLFLGNDRQETSTSRGTDRMLRQWFDRDNFLLYLAPHRLMQLAGERQRTGGETGPADGSLDRRVDDSEELRRIFPWLEDWRTESASFSPEAYRDLVTRRVEQACYPDDRRLRALRRRLLEMQKAAKGVPLAFVLIPAEFQVEDALWNEVARRLPQEELERDRPQREIAAWLEQHGIQFLDLLPVLRAAPAEADGNRHLYLLRDTHFNARGNAVAGHAMAEFLRQWLE